VNKWVLKVELNGEWEECTFATRQEALSAFIALASDYELNLRRAVLVSPLPGRDSLLLQSQDKTRPTFLN
jgi:hypothetical protein